MVNRIFKKEEYYGKKTYEAKLKLLELQLELINEREIKPSNISEEEKKALEAIIKITKNGFNKFKIK